MLKERFERTGSVKYEKTERAKTVLTENNEFAIALSVTEDPSLSVRGISENLNIKKSSVAVSLRENKFHPYHLQLHQELTDNDFTKRITFCQWAQHNVTYPLFVKNVFLPMNPHFIEMVLLIDTIFIFMLLKTHMPFKFLIFSISGRLMLGEI